MASLGLSRRLLAIGGASLLALWLCLLGFYYLANGYSRASVDPAPGQILSIAMLFRQQAEEDWPLLIDALATPYLTLRVTPEGPPPRNTTDLEGLDDYGAYRRMLGEQLLSVRLLAPDRGRRWLRPYMGARNPVQFRLQLQPGRVLVIETRSPVIFNGLGLPAGFGAGLLGTLFGVVALVLLHREVRPLIRLAEAVDRIDPTGAPVPLPVLKGAAPETRALVTAFERLQGRLHAILRARLALIGGIQHDVRTFATRLRLRLEHIPDEAVREKAVADITDMIELLDNALLSGRAGVGALDEELLDLAELLEQEVADRHGAGAPVSFSRAYGDPAPAPPPAGGDQAAPVIGDRLALRRIFANLIDNALCYGKTAHVTLTRDTDHLTVTIDDEGPGIAPDQRELLLEPFVRLETSRARKTGGAGLGLAVARTLAEAHGGSLRLLDAPGGGARAEIRLPCFRDAPAS
ncbi:HAMP domain-containing sensor histidine kinase [Rhizobium sp. CSW-27]|uniref:sensor histidine kinase n=1 Tax=Rhizobium sp. CSW-27 TaxID=2839985 RepID=UPI001C020882|nr:HAMP domain-containing sensor histidine kinase [Rhizobium sp. CSW-27]MBT9372314.1 HAMP domain-containing histidine kinase [Rhizobium sp. CSW-27]